MANVEPLQERTRLVKDDGTPTPFFMRWAQQRQIDISGGITAAQAQELIDNWAEARDINAGVGLDGGGNLSSDITIDLADTAVTPGIYGDATNTPQITVDQQGRITDVVDIPISGGGAGLEIEDEGVSIETATTLIDFVGAGVTVTSTAAGEVEVDIPGSTPYSLDIEDEGVSIETDVDKINFVGAGVTVTNPATGEVEVDIPGESGWVMIDQNGDPITSGATWTFSSAVANVDIINLDKYTDFLVFARNLTLSVAGNRSLAVSVNNGASFYTASGDYTVISTVGVETNTDVIASDGGGAVTAARSFFAGLIGFGAQGGFKATNMNNQDVTRTFIASADNVNALRISRTGGGGNLTGGVIYVFAR